MGADNFRMLMYFAVPLVPMWCHTGEFGKHGDPRDGASGDFRTS